MKEFFFPLGLSYMTFAASDVVDTITCKTKVRKCLKILRA